MNAARLSWLLLACVFWSRLGAGADAPAVLVDVITEDVARFSALLGSSIPERRVDGLQGLADLKHWPAEDAVVRLLDDRSPEVRRAAVMALGRMGGAKSIPRFIALLTDPSWELRQHVWLSLRAMTGQDFTAEDRQAWERWWAESTLGSKEKALLSTACQPNGVAGKSEDVASGTRSVNAASGRTRRKRPSPSAPVHPKRRDALRALSRLATSFSEEAILQLLQQTQSPPLEADERAFLCEALERAGSSRAVPVLAAQGSEAAAWALGHIGGSEAERALLGFAPTLPTLLALDRLHSTNARSVIPYLVGQMGQITFRGQPDDVMNEELQPIQRVGANLIRRTGLAPVFIECVLQELEDTMKPPIAHGARPAHPVEWDGMFRRMRSELKPGFVREDGTTTSQPIVAMCYLMKKNVAPALERGAVARATPRPTTEPETGGVSESGGCLVQRLIQLLHHTAFVPRVYVALALGRLQAPEALPPIRALIHEGYPFSDSVALASGKHFGDSQTVRWRGFLCLALGRLGSEVARTELGLLALDPKQPRDIRYCSVIGLGFIGSDKSLPVLERVAEADNIWMVRDAAIRASESIQMSQREDQK